MRQTSVFSLMAEPVQAALREAGMVEPTPPQIEAIPRILSGRNVLLIAATGSGKTEAALLPIFNELVKLRGEEGIYLLYITPLRALNRDLLKRLHWWGARLGFRVEVRHGDTPIPERRRQAAKPPEVLVTTPETLQAILPGIRIQQHLKRVRWVVVDEVHELEDDRRGVQLAVGLERLERGVGRGFQRIGLSATVGNPREVAAFLVGQGRQVEVVQVALPKDAKYFVEHPYPVEVDHVLAQTLYTSPEGAARINRICELADSHVSTLIFVNSRPNAEMLGSKLNMLRRDVGVHHGSLPREERERVEGDFKESRLKALICTSTLELGIDIGSVDLVLQYMSPRQVAALIQRVGRSGHRLDRVSEGVVLAVSADDVLESVAAIQRAQRGEVEPIMIHHNAMDVLAHQVIGCLLDVGGKAKGDDILKLVRQAHPYSQLSEEAFGRLVAFLEKLRYLRNDGGVLLKGSRSRTYYFENLSMIPDERRYPVVDVTTQQKVGILGDEFMMLKARVGLHFIVKGRVWRIEKIGEDGVVYVTPVADPTAAVPGWDGEILPVPFELAQRVGKLREEAALLLEKEGLDGAVKALQNTWPAEGFARRRVLEELQEQMAMGAPIPTHRRMLVEGFERYLIIHTCFGDVVNYTLGELFEELLMREGLVRSWWQDGYRILVELTVNTEHLDLGEIRRKLFDVPEGVLEGGLKSVLHRHGAFGYYMKFIAERFGVLPRGRFIGGEALKELWLRFRATPIYDETVREVLLLRLDLEAVREIQRKAKDGEVEVATFNSRGRPTPLAFHILNRYVDIPELIAPETLAKDSIEQMKMAIATRPVNLLCFNCTHLYEGLLVKDLDQRPLCGKCGSGLLGVVPWSAPFIKSALEKKMGRQALAEDEEKVLVKARRSADLVLAYGKKAIIAQCVYGVGPETASRVLARMHDSEEAFYRDLLEVKLRFITTRPFWDRP